MKEATTIDEEELVRQVLEESPVAERGVREEWAQQVGWHRQEDVHRHQNHTLRLGHPQMKQNVKTDNFWPLCILFFLLCAIALATKIRQSQKTRTV